MTDQDILDNPAASAPENFKFKSRRPSNVMMILGLFHLSLGIYSLYLFFRVIRLPFRSDATGLVIDYPFFEEIVLLKHLPLLLGIVLSIGGIGLMRHKMRGWKYALGASIFGVISPAVNLIIVIITPGQYLTGSGAFSYIILALFVLSIAFLLSKTIRRFFDPQTKDYFVIMIVAAILFADYMVFTFL